MRISILLLSIICSSTVYSQDTIWVDKSYQKVILKDSAEYYFFISERFIENELVGHIYYYPNGTKRAIRHKNPAGKWAGTVTEYYINGNKSVTGQFDNSGLYIGLWTEWNESGNVERIRESVRTDSWYRWKILYFRDSTGRVVVENGKGDYYELDEDGWVSASGKLTDGEKTGTWEGFQEDGTVRYREVYKKGEMVRGISFDGLEEIEYKKIQEPTHPVNGYQSFYTYISDNLVYPVEARRLNIQGKVFVQFIINEQGALTEAQVVKGVHPLLDKEALRIVSRHNGWTIPLQRGLPVKQRIIVPIVFVLD